FRPTGRWGIRHCRRGDGWAHFETPQMVWRMDLGPRRKPSDEGSPGSLWSRARQLRRTDMVIRRYQQVKHVCSMQDENSPGLDFRSAPKCAKGSLTSCSSRPEPSPPRVRFGLHTLCGGFSTSVLGIFTSVLTRGAYGWARFLSNHSSTGHSITAYR